MRKLNTVKLKQGTPEWLEFRKNKIGASDAPAIMGVSKNDTPFQLMEQKLGLAVKEETYGMSYGKKNEEPARRLFETMTGLIVFPVVAVSNSRHWQIASYDGVTLEEDVFTEIKCNNKENHELARAGKVPEEHYPQVQQQNEVGSFEQGLYFSWHEGEGIIVEVKRDQSYIDRLNEEEEKFMDLLKKGEMPAMTERDFDDLINNEYWRENVPLFETKYKILKALEKEVEEIKKGLIGQTNGRSAKGYGLTLTRIPSKGAVEYAKIPELAGVDTDAYRKAPFTKWRTSFTK